MFELLAQVKEVDNQLKEINAALRELKSYDVFVGIPEDTSPRKAGTVSNAELLYIHTNGSAVNNIPPRPVLEKAIEHHKEEIADLLKKASDSALSGNITGIKPALEKAGQHGQNVAQQWFRDPRNGWKGNEPSTEKRKLRKGKPPPARPLIDTGQMRKSIVYVVKKG